MFLKTRILLFVLLSFLLNASVASAQLAFGMQTMQNSQRSFFPADTVPKDSIRPKTASPKTAAILSACLPGLGQAYNRRYGCHSLWKIPVIYAGFGGLGIGFGFNQKLYAQYRNALRLRYDDDPSTVDDYPEYSDDDLVTLKNYYQRYRDLCVIGAAALYTLQVLDAAVDAHLSTFDMGDDLSLQVRPSLFPTQYGMTTMIGLRVSFR